MRRRSLLFSSASATVLAAMAPRTALTQGGLGGQPLKIIVATPAGGASDAAARLLAQSLARNLGQPVLVENKPGGNGAPAVQAALSAPPDGHTLLWVMASMAGMPLLMKSPPIKSLGEFAPVTTVVVPKPRRVRNIFICSTVLFCASSRITKASLRVRPRM